MDVDRRLRFYAWDYSTSCVIATHLTTSVMGMKELLSIVIPCLNEHETIPTLLARLADELPSEFSHEIIVVDDGSNDGTLDILKSLTAAYPMLRYISLSRNFGHQQALKAGLDHARGAAVITMDADLQHPPRVIRELVERWKSGFDIVYTIRKPDASLSLFKRASSKAFYALINMLIEYPIDRGAADFRLLDRKVVAVITSLHDPFLFLRGLIPWLGFRQCSIAYSADARFAGSTKYSLIRMGRLAIHGVTSFGIQPLRFATLAGSAISLTAFAYAIYAFVIYFVFDIAVPGWASIVSSILFLGGIQLIVLGIIGEYVGMLYVQSKSRPSYIIREASKELSE